MQHSNVSLLTLLLVGGILVALGYGWAVMKRANKDYKATRNAVKSLRKSFWASLWAVVKVGTFAAIAVVVIVAWNLRDARDDRNTPLLPALVDRPSPSATRG